MGANRLNLYPGKLTLDEFKEVTWGDHPDWELVEDGEWVNQGKYDHCTQVVKELATGKFYEYTCLVPVATTRITTTTAMKTICQRFTKCRKLPKPLPLMSGFLYNGQVY